MKRWTLILLISLACGFLLSCGGMSPTGGGIGDCVVNGITVLPSSSGADHTALVPFGQVQFYAKFSFENGCVSPSVDLRPGWSTSDPVNTRIDSNGLATCLGTTAQAAAITASYGKFSGTASLICR